MFESLLVAALLTVSDPSGDVTGGGTLSPPSAAVYRNLATFDLRQVTVTDDPQLTLVIEMGSLSNPFELPLDFSLPVIEVYVSGDEGGRAELLSGSGMRLAPQQVWELAVRLTGEEATAYRATGGGTETATPEVTSDGNSLVVATPFPRPERPRLYAITGLYDLFGATPWRPVDDQESPWAFSSDSQRRPVVDVLARDEAAQRQALESGVLTPMGGRMATTGAIWLILMAVGLLLSLLGIAVRTVSRRTPSARMGNAEEPSPMPTRPGGVNPTTGADNEDPASYRWQPRETRAGSMPNSGSVVAVEKAGEADTGAAETGPVERRANEGKEEEGSEEAAAQQKTAEPPQMKPFTWDSSALLTDPGDDEAYGSDFADGFGAEFGRPEARSSSKDVWQRPVPLSFNTAGTSGARRSDAGSGSDGAGDRGTEADDDLELVRDEDEPRNEPD
ncbi:MAG: glucodextranase DOMON-like domain-containing protein [Trueperaceae bacterium]